jgi:hypothetical protein
VLGLALTQVLKALTELAQRRSRVRGYWPAVAWAMFAIAAVVQTWWSAFPLRDREGWTFGGFAILLTQAGLVYLFAAMVLPDDRDGEIDLKAHYQSNRRWIFAALAGLLVVSMVREAVLFGRWPGPVNLGFHLVALPMCVVLVLRVPEWVHRASVLGALAGLGLYIVVLFPNLP